MKKWLKTLVTRVGDLIVKMIAVKYVACGILTGLYLASTEKTTAMFLAIVALWALASGLRAYEKKLEARYGPTRRLNRRPGDDPPITGGGDAK